MDLAKLKTGDILIAMGGKPITGADDLIRLLGADKIGREMQVTVLSSGKVHQVNVVPRERG